ncbi:hypothetical protein EBE87_25875 [Pseudoroseomonas wenyumeiae]|uniref:Uncharacterized protein n=1 Tax=Teichococcus wenyumeiae TaxID=2478470 RepID=A0ABX9VC11_9PROT|nr:hypothetical protein [Pseudoroseomonas wenyumeiae]RMI15408.1 hypothetical protein EBE87_25875 [Pseudoroseomonas wenyumeiae]
MTGLEDYADLDVSELRARSMEVARQHDLCCRLKEDHNHLLREKMQEILAGRGTPAEAREICTAIGRFEKQRRKLSSELYRLGEALKEATGGEPG